MAFFKPFHLLGFLFAILVLVSSVVSARDLSTEQKQKEKDVDLAGRGGYNKPRPPVQESATKPDGYGGGGWGGGGRGGCGYGGCGHGGGGYGGGGHGGGGYGGGGHGGGGYGGGGKGGGYGGGGGHWPSQDTEPVYATNGYGGGGHGGGGWGGKGGGYGGGGHGGGGWGGKGGGYGGGGGHWPPQEVKGDVSVNNHGGPHNNPPNPSNVEKNAQGKN